MAALDYMTNDLAEMRRDDHGDKVRELNKRSVDDAKSLRDAREKFMELEGAQNPRSFLCSFDFGRIINILS